MATAAGITTESLGEGQRPATAPAVAAQPGPSGLADRAGETTVHDIRVTESRTADYVNGDDYVVPVGAMIDVDALEEQIATSRTYSAAALADDIDAAARQAVAPHLEPGETSMPVEMSLALDAPALIDSRLAMRLTLAAAEGPRLTFDVAVHDSAGRSIATARHVRRIVDGRTLQRELIAQRDADTVAG